MRLLLLLGLIMMAPAARADELPVPPVPPEQLTQNQLAPTPDVDARNPIPATSEAPSVEVKLYRAQPYDPGFGFAPGSRYQSAEDRRPIPTPGLSITVPIK